MHKRLLSFLISLILLIQFIVNTNASINPSVVGTSTTYHAVALVVGEEIFSEGFESGDFSAWSGTVVWGGGSLTVSSEKTHHGSYSEKASVTGSGTWSGEAYAYKNIQGISELYARIYVYIQSCGIQSQGDRCYFLRFMSSTEGIAWFGIRFWNGALLWDLIVRDGADYYAAWSGAVEVGKWHCLEGYWKKDSANGIGRLYVDGALTVEITGKDTSYFGDAASVLVGLVELPQQSGNTIVYIDCVAVADAYIGLEEIWSIAEQWLFKIRNPAWFSIETWTFQLGTGIWNLVEQWILSMRNPAWFIIENWLINIRNPQWITIETWIINIGTGFWNIVEQWTIKIVGPALLWFQNPILFMIVAIVIFVGCLLFYDYAKRS